MTIEEQLGRIDVRLSQIEKRLDNHIAHLNANITWVWRTAIGAFIVSGVAWMLRL